MKQQLTRLFKLVAPKCMQKVTLRTFELEFEDQKLKGCNVAHLNTRVYYYYVLFRSVAKAKWPLRIHNNLQSGHFTITLITNPYWSGFEQIFTQPVLKADSETLRGAKDIAQMRIFAQMLVAAHSFPCSFPICPSFPEAYSVLKSKMKIWYRFCKE